MAICVVCLPGHAWQGAGNGDSDKCCVDLKSLSEEMPNAGSPRYFRLRTNSTYSLLGWVGRKRADRGLKITPKSPDPLTREGVVPPGRKQAKILGRKTGLDFSYGFGGHHPQRCIYSHGRE